MNGHRRARLALAGLLLLGSSGTALVFLASGAGADNRPATWSGYAEASGFRFSVVKPAQLPTQDEVAGLSVPFTRAESDSSPIGRAIGSWVWPGETAAAAKSLLLVGLDPSAAESERLQRERENPGHGCDPKRTLQTPAVTNPQNPGEVLVPAQTLRSPVTNQPLYDPTDNPCGEAAVRTALQTAVNERVPEYPFWAHSLWPPTSSSDQMDRSTVCDAPSWLPPKYGLPTETHDPCPSEAGAAKGGLVEAISNEGGNWGTAQAGSLDVPGIAKAAEITSTSRVEWIGTVLLASASVTINDLMLLGPEGVEFLRIKALTSTAAVASDDRLPVSHLEAAGVTVTLGGVRYDAVIERNRLRIADRSLPPDVQNQLNGGLDGLSRRLGFGTCSAPAGCEADASGAAEAAAVPAGYDATTRTARAAGISIVLTGTNSVEGATTVRLSFGLAEAAALSRFSQPYVPPPQPGFDASDPVPGRGAFAPPAGPPVTVGDPVPPQRFGARPLRGVLPSEPVPIAVVVIAILGMVAGGGALVAAGLWETVF